MTVLASRVPSSFDIDATTLAICHAPTSENHHVWQSTPHSRAGNSIHFNTLATPTAHSSIPTHETTSILAIWHS
jgi:hypothetical protein